MNPIITYAGLHELNKRQDSSINYRNSYQTTSNPLLSLRTNYASSTIYSQAIKLYNSKKENRGPYVPEKREPIAPAIQVVSPSKFLNPGVK
jgi:hypothetical protein